MLFGTMNVNSKNHLEIGGIDVTELVKQYKTPLYVFDKQHIEDMINLFKNSFGIDGLDTEVIYASKAFMSIGICELMQENNVSMDVVSSGELYTAKRSGFDMNNIYFHGNNKTIEELNMALDYGVGHIVVDNLSELSLLVDIATKRKQYVSTLFRVNPGIEAHTHEYIQTSKLSSKFGESIYDEDIIDKIMKTYIMNKYVRFKGFHCHIGSQIFEEISFLNTVDVMVDFIEKVEKKFKYPITTLNLGGGFGIYYTEGDKPVDLSSLLPKVLKRIKTLKKNKNISLNKVLIEPGRAIVGNAGTTLYSVGGIKNTYGGKKYIFIDGGMTDNIRPALYGANYSVDIATKMNSIKDDVCDIAGKCCESGDIIAIDKNIQRATVSDIVAVYSTGAYTYSMASNYNRLRRPAVVFVKDGESQLVIRRESYEDLIRNDVVKVKENAHSI